MTPSAGRAARPIDVFLVCSGLGNVNRGFESFSDECFRALADEAAVRIQLFQGGGERGQGRTVLPTLGRKSRLARALGRVVRRDPFWTEQRTFFRGLVPHLARREPRLVYFSEPFVGVLLERWRRSQGAGFRLLLSNGGPAPWSFRAWDHVQQLTPGAFRTAREAGWPAERQSVVPYGISVGAAPPPATAEEVSAIRARLGIPAGVQVLLSVAAIDASHKRVDYLVRELAALGTAAPHLVVLGEEGEETAAIRAAALGLPNGCTMRCVPHAETGDYYRSADAFVLASLDEGFGRVFLEAMMHGLPCVAHDYHVTRFLLGRLGHLGDLRRAGGLRDLLGPALAARHTRLPLLLQRRVQRRFSWPVLRARYVQMLRRAAATPLS